jgi:predicted nucleic acid-binding Zn ribbon protein
MAQRVPTALRALLPNVLVRLSRESGDARPLSLVWADVVGEVTARHSRTLALDGKTLVVQVDSPRRAQALRLQEREILAGLVDRLGRGVITTLVYRAVEKK